MSRLPTISTPSRASSSTGLPTPSSRRPRSSLGVSQHRNSGRDDDPAADAALQEALKHRPPSSLRNVHTNEHDPDTPTGLGVSTRTPGGLRARTPSALGHGHHPTTPSTSRAVSRASRPSVGSATPLTTRRVSMASSTTSATPYGRRPESRAAGADHWTPTVGERVRMQAMGMEGTLRYIGETEFKAGVWAGVELEGGFAGKGKNDGSVNGITYFTCPPQCGVFILAVKLSAPTSGISRPPSVASSHLSFASSTSYQSGRLTPSLGARPSTTTPSRALRSVSSVRPHDDDARPVKTLLGNSSSSNAAIAESKITAGSRASKYIGMTAKQLENARSGLGVSVRSSATPRPSRVSMGGPTPGRPRASLGTSLATPRARVPRASEMPPPPSPGMVGKVQAQQSKLEEELRELRERNAQLEEALASARSPVQPTHSDDDMDALREQAEMLRKELDASHADATDASKLAEELQLARDGLQNIIDEKEKQLGALRRDMKVAAERAQGELDAGMEAKREEVARLQERAEVAEQDGSEMRALVEELTQAGQATISLYENKQYDLEDKIRSLEEKSRLLEDRLAKAREESEAAAAGLSSKQAISAAEIDNETLTAQLKHFQNRVSVLEEELEEVRTQAEADGETWKTRLNKAKASEKAIGEKEREAREEVKKLERAANGAKTRIQEMSEALKENRGLLEVARAEIETMRVEVAEVVNMRTALQNASEKDKVLASTKAELEQVKEQSAKASGAEALVKELQAKITSLESQITSLNNLPRPSSPAPQKGRLSTSSNPEGVDKRLRGFQHIISDLSTENAELKEKYTNVMEEVELLKEENKLLEETKELANGSTSGDSSNEVLAAQATIKKHEQTIQELNREMAELESLIESKIYREDELENRLAEVEKQLEKHRAIRGRDGSPVPSGHSRSASSVTAQSTYSQGSNMSNGRPEERCELCEGPHDLDACPVFAGNMMPDAGKANGAGTKKGGRWCADCESSEHDTAECPMAEDVF